MISIIIPVYNDPNGLKDTVQSIIKQETSEEFELIIADNNSTDNTRSVARSYAEEYDWIDLSIEDSIQSSYAARNTGIEQATGSILVFIDADIIVDENWLNTVASEIRDRDYVTYDMSVFIPDGKNTLAARYDRHTGFPIEEYAKKRNFGAGGCIAVRRSVFEDVGRFDHRLISGGDAEFGHRVAASGREIYFTPETQVYHPARTSLRSQIKKEIRVGRGFCQLQRYYPDRYGQPGIPPRPEGSGNAVESSSRTKTEQIAFGVLGLLFLGCRGLGYLLELVAGESRNRATDSSPAGDAT
jgi:glycosyltransferase involved in cell wall biosynthesis